MKSGQLRNRITIKRPTDDNLHAKTYETLGTVWASVKPLYGVQLEQARAMHANTTHEVRLRYYADVLPMPFDVLEHGSKTYNVLSLRITNSVKSEVVILAVENG